MTIEHSSAADGKRCPQAVTRFAYASREPHYAVTALLRNISDFAAHLQVGSAKQLVTLCVRVCCKDITWNSVRMTTTFDLQVLSA